MLRGLDRLVQGRLDYFTKKKRWVGLVAELLPEDFEPLGFGESMDEVTMEKVRSSLLERMDEQAEKLQTVGDVAKYIEDTQG